MSWSINAKAEYGYYAPVFTYYCTGYLAWKNHKRIIVKEFYNFINEFIKAGLLRG